MGEWFTTFFDSLVNDFWDAAMPAEATAAEVLGNSVGYFEPPGTVRFLAGVARLLRPGGRFGLGSSRLLLVARRP